jgi:hypothetical protein
MEMLETGALGLGCKLVWSYLQASPIYPADLCLCDAHLAFANLNEGTWQ